MSNPTTTEEFLKVETEFLEAIKNFKPVFGNTEHIALAKRLSRLGMDTELYQKHLNNKRSKMVTVYRKKVYDGRKGVTSSLNYYFKKSEQK